MKLWNVVAAVGIWGTFWAAWPLPLWRYCVVVALVCAVAVVGVLRDRDA